MKYLLNQVPKKYGPNGSVRWTQCLLDTGGGGGIPIPVALSCCPAMSVLQEGVLGKAPAMSVQARMSHTRTCKGTFSHSAGTAHAQRSWVFARGGGGYVVCPGNTPENHPPTEACMINSKQHGVQNSGPWDLWQASDKKKSLVYQQGL